MCVVRDGVILAQSEHLPHRDGETPQQMRIRFRTLGDITTITGAVESDADTLEKIAAEVAATRVTERGRMTTNAARPRWRTAKKKNYF